MKTNYKSSLHFKHRIEIMELKPVQGPYPDQEETLFSKAWADIKTMKGYEYNTATLAGNVGKTRFIIRYMKGIKPTMHILYKGLTYTIESIENDDEDNRTITLITEAELPR